MLQRFFLISCLAGCLIGSGCARQISPRAVKKMFRQSKIVNDHFTGFALYDLDKHQMIYELNSAKYFTPASNTKLFTFYTCLKMLDDSIPGLRYAVRGDSLLFWGTGDPSFLHSDLRGTKALQFLAQSGKKLFFCDDQYDTQIYGNGWAWNDYNDYYQAEINELPLEDNVALFYADEKGTLQARPALMKALLKCDSTFNPANFTIKRDFVSNTFLYPAMPVPAKFKQEIPWKTSTTLTLNLLQDTLKQPVLLIHRRIPADAKVIYNAQADTVYRHMLQPSDNFIAEQLLLVCASVKFKTLNTDSVRQYAINNFMADLPDHPQWADGSGLSRQNLFTPRSIISILLKISNQLNDDQLLHNLLPAGGVSGTIKNVYKTDNGKAFVWAKTGSLNNNYNQSGYLITREGRRLAFTFMNNNFTRPTREIRNEMVRIITHIHETF